MNQSLQYLPTEEDEVEDLFLLLKGVKVMMWSSCSCDVGLYSGFAGVAFVVVLRSVY